MPTPSSKERDRHRGKKLKQKRREQEITQDQIAERIGVTPQTIRNMENGEGWNQIDKIAALCGCLHIEINQLANLDKEEKGEENLNLGSDKLPVISKGELIDLIRECLETDKALIPKSIMTTEENIESYNSEV
ncbi:helix-turn-helix transcriptional regulator [Leptothoe sp. PORK10 BA2]|uniref:helix-turn-helix transcriptional regulator n=1 Tax=Leptothoe sp. PORK10 BA2 TaxID=3110254 RepID=UPI002B205AEF|nr:helix-turn-helix transcriptional regulator [Leptothoe sp. PORK10 BA2]MEA5467035.1 helix-turn-helix transcriptional regulator [Leptothoe sp. PORK10 BA2]